MNPWFLYQFCQSRIKFFTDSKPVAYLLFVTAACFPGLAPASSEAAAQPPLAGQYFGLGMSRLSISSDHPSIDDQSIFGISLLWGMQYNNHILELSIAGGSGVDVGPTPDIYYPEDSADYGSITLSYQYHFHNLTIANSIFPYLGLGYSFNSINWNNYVYDQSGTGLTIIGGAIITLEKNWAVNFTIRRYEYSGEKLLFAVGDYANNDSEIYEFAAIIEYFFR
jgi:opacity protein-like surface antigen